jgi:serine/threonine protein kinase
MFPPIVWAGFCRDYAHTTIKVVDFGLAKFMGLPSHCLGVAAAEHTVLCTPCGTLRYCAPEILAPRAYCERIPYDMVCWLWP